MMSVAVLISIAGCGDGGPSLVQVKGKITYDGTPLSKAQVIFNPGAGVPAFGVTGENGEYTLSTNGSPGVPAGDYLVSVVKKEEVPESNKMTPMDMQKMAASGKKYEPPKDLINAKYSDANTSGLTATVSSSNKQINFDLKSE